MNTVKKLRSISPYNIGEFESWLSDLAKTGLQLSGFQSFSCKFVKTEPQEMEYRIELSRKALAQELIDLYQECGWNYVCSYRGAHIFCAPTSASLVEVHTDPAEQSYTLKKSISFLYKLVFFELLLVLFFIADTIFYINIGNTPYLNLIDGGFQYVIGFAGIFYCLMSVVWQLARIIRIRSDLKMGIMINHHANWRKNTIYTWIISAAIIIPSLLSCFYSYRYLVVSIAGMNEWNLTLDSDLEIVRLNDIESYSNPVLRVWDSNKKRNLYNYVHEQDMLMYRKYEITETFHLEKETWEGYVYEPSLRTEAYELKTPLFADGVFHDVLNKAMRYYIGEATAQKITYPGLDTVYYVRDDTSDLYAIVIRQGQKIITLQYCGKQPYEKVLQAAVQILN